MTITQEQLKVIAEGMGYEAQPLTNQFNGLMVIFRGRGRIPFSYNPLTNNDQMVEIMERLKLSTSHLINPDAILATLNISFLDAEYEGDTEFEGKTIHEAVCNAAYEYFKGKNNDR